MTRLPECAWGGAVNAVLTVSVKNPVGYGAVLMDVARKFRADLSGDDGQRARPRPAAETGFDSLEKVFRLSTPTEGQREPMSQREPLSQREPEVQRERISHRLDVLTSRDIARALDLIHDAAQKIRAAEDQARDGEAKTQALLTRATEELAAMESRTQAAEARARVAEARLQDAETRAKEAEAWLRQIFTTIADELPPQA